MKTLILRQLVALAVVAGFAGSSAAADATFTSESAFAAAASGSSIESFESLAGRSRVLLPVAAPLFTVTPLTAPLGVQTAPDSPDSGFGAAATDGTHYLSVYLPGAAQGTLQFDLPVGTTAFGLNIMDVGETAGTVSMRTNTGAFSADTVLLSFPPLQGSGVVQFVGLSQTVPFTQVFITVSGVDEAYGIDKAYVQAVPEPATAALMFVGLAGFSAWRWRSGSGARARRP